MRVILEKLLILLLLTILVINRCSLLGNELKDVLKNADLFLDMSEYKIALEYYKKALILKPELIDIRKNIAYAYFELGEREEAIKFLKEELTLFPENGDAYDLLVYILFKLNRIEEAYDIFEKYNIRIKSNKKSPNIGLADLILGIHFKDNKMFNKAKKYLRRAMERGYDPVKCYVKLIEIELAQEDFKSIRSVIDEAFKFCSERPEILFMEGIYYFKESQRTISVLRNAINSFEKAISLNPYFEEALFNLAAIYYNFNDFKKAIVYLEKILKISPKNSEIEFFLNCSLSKLNKSFDNFQFCLEKCPESISLKMSLFEEIEYKYQYKNDKLFILQNINSLALNSIREGKLEEAIKKLLNGLKVNKESPEINYNLGMVYFLSNNLIEAERYAIRATKDRAFVVQNEGKAYERPFVFGKTKEYRIRVPSRKLKREINSAESIPVEKWTFGLALEMGNHFLEAYDLLGNIYFKSREFDKSVLAFKKVITIDERDAMGYYNLGCAYFAMKKYDEAEKNWENAIKYDKRKKERGEEGKEEVGEKPRVSVTVLKRTVSFHSYKSLGSLYQEKGEIKKAIESYQKAIEIFPTDADCYYELGKLYIQTGEKENAIKNLQKYLEYGTEKEKEVRELLQKLKEK